MLDALARSLANHGPDGGGHKQTLNVGVVFREYRTDHESKLEKQPLVSTLGHILAWDGRLDNRSDLFSRLRDLADRQFTDAELVMGSYLAWGAGFLCHLIGDFALCLWDPNTRTLLLARDPFGTRPLYYQVTPQRLIWSSELATLVDSSALPLEVDEDYLAGYLNNAADTSLTAYKNIHCVPPGTALIVRGDRIDKQEFWGPGLRREIRYQSDSEYEEHFLDLFRESVRCRLRADGPVWAELSGGLDSSSIVCMADEITESGEAGVSQLETVSYVYDNSAGSDERRFITEVEEKRRRPGHHFREDDSVGRFQDVDLATVVRPNPIYRFTARHDWVRARMQEMGSRVLLSGVGGDNLLWSGAEVSPQLADLLVQLRLPSLHRQVTGWSQATKNSYAGTLWRGAVRPLLPRALQKRFDSHRPASTLIDRTFAKRMRGLEERIADPLVESGLPSACAECSMLGAAIRSISSCYYRDRVPTEYRFPFLHRPLVEFLLAIPIEQKLRPAENRSLQRRALRHTLPARILNRQSKRWSTEALCRTLANNWSEVAWLFKEPRVCEYGFVDAMAFAGAAKRVRHGLQNLAGELLLILSIELWLRAFDLRKTSSLQEVKLAS
jgi:asparagine synthase (glutamine-hydrolysing)